MQDADGNGGLFFVGRTLQELQGANLHMRTCHSS